MRPFLVSGADGNLNCLFVQEVPFSENGDGLTTTFSNFPPLPTHNRSGLIANRGHVGVTSEAVVKLQSATSLKAALYGLTLAIRRRLVLDVAAVDIVIRGGDIEQPALSIADGRIPNGGHAAVRTGRDILPMLLSAGDITVSRAARGYTLGIVEQEAAGALAWSWFVDKDSWEGAVEVARAMAVKFRVRAWAQPNGHECIELVLAYDEDTPWSGSWYPLNQTSIDLCAPHGQGVYLLGAGQASYVGDSDDLNRRLTFHHESPLPCLQHIRPLLFSCVVPPPDVSSHELAESLITRWMPHCNQAT